jgi:hypothetical protein
MTAAIEASAGHSRSQKMVHRARPRARASTPSPVRSCGGSWWEVAAFADRSIKSISGKENLPDINMQLDACQRAKEGAR